jgi:hypothetical protein
MKEKPHTAPYNTENAKKHFLEVWNWMHSDKDTRISEEEMFTKLEAKYGITAETCIKFIDDRIAWLKKTDGKGKQENL